MELGDKITGYFSSKTGTNANASVGEVINVVPFSTDEEDTGRTWIDGSVIFRLVVQLPGANLITFATVPALNNTFAISMTCLTTLVGIQTPLTELILNPVTAPQLTANHPTIDLTGETLTFILEYVKT